MAENTGVDPQQLRDSAKRIGDIMNDDAMHVFEDLGNHQTTAGSFPTAKWLNSIVHDRVTAVQQQAQILHAAFGDICTSLNTVADDMQNTDSGNADKVAQDIDTLKSNVSSDVSSIGGSGGNGSSSHTGGSSGNSDTGYQPTDQKPVTPKGGTSDGSGDGSGGSSDGKPREIEQPKGGSGGNGSSDGSSSATPRNVEPPKGGSSGGSGGSSPSNDDPSVTQSDYAPVEAT